MPAGMTPPAGQVGQIGVTLPDAAALSDWAIAFLTAVLVGVTIWYANHTRKMVDEMRRSRQEEAENRRREKSDRSGYACLDAVRGLANSILQRGPTAVNLEDQKRTYYTLLSEAPLLADEQVRDRVLACAEALSVGFYSNEALKDEGLSPRSVGLGVQDIVLACKSVLEDYLAERDTTIDRWVQTREDGRVYALPQRAEAAAWIRSVGQGGQ